MWPSLGIFSASSDWLRLIFSLLASVFPSNISLWGANLSHFSPSTDLKSPRSLCSRTILVHGQVCPVGSPLPSLSPRRLLQPLSKQNPLLLTAHRTRSSAFYLPTPFLIPNGPFSTLTARVCKCGRSAAPLLFSSVPLARSRASSSAARPPSWLGKLAAGCWLGAPNSSNAIDSPTARNPSRSATTRWGDLETEGLCQPSQAWPGLGTACDWSVVISTNVQAAQLLPLVKLSPKGDKEKALVSNSNYMAPYGWNHCLQTEDGEERHTDVFSTKLIWNN